MLIFAATAQQFAGYFCITIGIWVVLFGLRLNRRRVDKHAPLPASVRAAVQDEISSEEDPGDT